MKSVRICTVTLYACLLFHQESRQAARREALKTWRDSPITAFTLSWSRSNAISFRMKLEFETRTIDRNSFHQNCGIDLFLTNTALHAKWNAMYRASSNV